MSYEIDDRVKIGIDLRLVIQIKSLPLLAFTMKYFPMFSKWFIEIDDLTLQLADKHFNNGVDVEFYMVCESVYHKMFQRLAKDLKLDYPLSCYTNLSYLHRSSYLSVLTCDAALCEITPYFVYVAPSFAKIKSNNFFKSMQLKMQSLLDKLNG